MKIKFPKFQEWLMNGLSQSKNDFSEVSILPPPPPRKPMQPSVLPVNQEQLIKRLQSVYNKVSEAETDATSFGTMRTAEESKRLIAQKLRYAAEELGAILRTLRAT